MESWSPKKKFFSKKCLLSIYMQKEKLILLNILLHDLQAFYSRIEDYRTLNEGEEGIYKNAESLQNSIEKLIPEFKGLENAAFNDIKRDIFLHLTEDCGKSQKEIAQFMGVSESYLSEWKKRNNIPFDKLLKLFQFVFPNKKLVIASWGQYFIV